MNILYVSRLFTGLETSLATGCWQPTGVPTIYRVLEALAQDHQVQVVLTVKDGVTVADVKMDTQVTLKGLPVPVTVLAGSRYGHRRGFLAKAGRVVRELRHGWKIIQTARYAKPDLIYIDHANIFTAGLLAHLVRTPVVLRIMGIYPIMREALSGSRLSFRLLRWAYRAPYALVICTQDGSGGREWLDQALQPGVVSELVLNGVDIVTGAVDDSSVVASSRPGTTTILFVGKFEKEKGCQQFLEAFIRASQREPGSLRAVMIGSGSQRELLDHMARDSGLERSITFVERLPHAQVLSAQKSADIYVSLNRLGNLSNANLEAMRTGACMILPAFLPDVGSLDPAAQYLPEGSYVHISDPDAVAELTDEILRLHHNPQERRRLKTAMEKASALMQTWDERVAWELEQLESIATQGAKR